MADKNKNHRNRLAHETSPYLLQHADNPVDWYPWGEEAFEKARTEDKPILLSVGYSACHWCHVMAHESFEDEHIASLMNDYYINVKVDREERPDVDSVYMTAVQAITGQGGWPMTVFMTPDGKPFYAGTYFPPEDGYGRPGFPRVLESLRIAWVNEREKLLESAEEITAHLRRATQRVSAAGELELTPELPEQAVGLFRQAFDGDWGGFGQAPKFPSPANLDFLLSHHARTGGDDGVEPGALAMVLHTLRRMATGGMYDQLGGGFSRYSVDRYWLVPHFEKMLYDNAQLARTYLHAYQITGDTFYERVVRETLDYLLREMLHPEGGFYAAQDADSEGIEGKYFVWTVDEVRTVLGDDADFFMSVYGVTEEGNFRDPHHPELTGRNVLSRMAESSLIARQFETTAEDVERRIPGVRARMLAEREKRVRPGLDDKVLASWNGLALAAFAEAGRVLREPQYREAAERNAAFVRDKLWRDGRLLHTYKDGRSRIDGMLEDYSYYGLGLVELFKLTGDLGHLTWAQEMLDTILRDFRDQQHGGFFETSASGEELLLRQKPAFDSATPSGNGAVGLLALWLSRYYGRKDLEDVALEVITQVHDHLLQAPTGFGVTWQIIEFLLSPPRELVIVGDSSQRASFEAVAARQFLPWLIIAPTAGGGGLPLFEGREDTGRPLAFVCENMVCNLPAHSPDELVAHLG
jgi:uncharacterized protein